jgi:uncharacterized protein (TIGR03437 family)
MFQKEASVEGGYKLLAGGLVGFRVGRYDRTKPLVIDPVISYATYLGNASSETPTSLTVDGQGNAYVAGSASTCASGTCISTAFVAKLNSTGTALIYSTFIGGAGFSYANGVVVDSAGNAYLAGSTDSPVFPVTPDALRTTAQNGDGFLAKLDPTGAKLLYSTFLGGAWPNFGSGGPTIAISPSGDLYVAGQTYAADFPILNALQPKPGGTDCASLFPPNPPSCSDAFVMHWRSSDMTLLYSTFLGGSNNDGANAVAADSAGDVYIVGSTYSADFPVMNAIQPTFGGGICQFGIGPDSPCPDAFITKISVDGKSILYSTFLGGQSADEGLGIAVDSAGEAYVAGGTVSADFPTTNALQSTPGCCFIAKLNAQGSGLVFSTYFKGGEGPIAVDSMGNAFVAGSGRSLTNFSPTIIEPSRLNPCAGGAAGPASLLAEFRPDGSLAYIGILGGTSGDSINGIAVDHSGKVYVAGTTGSGDFPVTAAAYQTDFASGFVAKIDPAASPAEGITLAPACIVNAASYLNWKLQSAAVPQTFPLSGFVAPGEVISIFGDNLGPTAGTETVIDEQGRIVTSLAGVMLTFDGVPAPLLYVQASQINAIVPFAVAGKASTMVQLRYNGATSNAARLLVADVVPGIFTIEGRGVQIAAINQDGNLNSAANPAERYSTISMWATGFGPLSQSYADGQIVYGSPALVVNPPTICFNGHDAKIQYFGQAPNLVAGAIQINLILPDVPPGPNQVLFNCMNEFPYGTIYVK